ncbi:hypothetical protein Ciccas_001359 [Cichlidogyrus casuarinus]|uniref:Uncharacterized protein n=1 Tax=Cichlidogyrus casuarinus TaxID=1844966 RepID=A0ABD2QKI0_9PLAT
MHSWALVLYGTNMEPVTVKSLREESKFPTDSKTTTSTTTTSTTTDRPDKENEEDVKLPSLIAENTKMESQKEPIVVSDKQKMGNGAPVLKAPNLVPVISTFLSALLSCLV